MIKKTIGLLVVVILLVVGAGSAGLAYQRGSGRFAGNGLRQQAYNWLDLTDEQRDELLANRDDFFAKRTELQNDLYEKNQELKNLILTDEPEAKIKELTAAIQELQNSIIKLRKEYWTGLNQILTKEQIDKLKESGDKPFNQSGYNSPFQGYRGHMRGYGARQMGASGFGRGYANRKIGFNGYCPFM